MRNLKIYRAFWRGGTLSKRVRSYEAKKLSRLLETISFAEQTDKVFSPLTSHLSLKRAFTLAEVLITLGVIGVVAALTMPMFIEEHQKKVAVTGLKKGYNMFSSAFYSSEAEYGYIKDWEGMERDSECSGYSGPSVECSVPFVNKYLKDLKVVEYKKRNEKIYPIRGLKPNSDLMFVSSRNIKWFYLADGTCFFLATNYDNNLFSFIFYDVNGDKKPNVVGKDIFVFDFGQIHGYKFDFESGFANLKTYNGDIKKWLTEDSRTACSKTFGWDNYNSFSCGALIQYNDWKIPKDYPW